MVRRKCCVTGCESTSETHCLYRFPRNNRLRQLWMSFVVPHSSSLLMLTEDQLLNKTVCQLHFEPIMFDSHGNRMVHSYPSLFTENEITHRIPLNSGGTYWNHTTEHSYCKRTNDDESMEIDYIDENEASIFILRPKESLEHSYVQTHVQTKQTPSSDTMIKTSSVLEDFSSICVPHTSVSNPHEELEVDNRNTNKEPCCSVALPNIAQERFSSNVDYSKQRKKVVSERKISSKKRRLASKIINLAKDSVGENSTQKAQELHSSELMNEFHKLNNQTKTFIKIQLKAVQANKNSRRYNLQEKLLCLQMYKQSPKSYKLLQNMFALPNKRTLERLAEKIKFSTGINENIFAVIKEKVNKWPQEKKLCSIVFDEVALSTHLTFNEEKDAINGFFDIGGERKMKFCDHALVIMIRGVCSSWRQPLAYYFVEGTIAAVELKNILRKIVIKIIESCLVPIALVCDQGSTFRTALKQFREETLRQRNIDGVSDDGTISISGFDLSIIFDPPHLLKGIRNNFLNKDMVFGSKIAKWDDIMTVFDVDNTLGHTRALPKLTMQHVDKDAMRKMRVSVAAQVLSARVAAMLRYTDAVVKYKDGEPMSQTMATTAEAVEFLDQLFDSVNGRPGDAAKGKMRTAVKPTSLHVSFWREAIKKIDKIKFIDKNGRHAYVPSLQGWTTTLESFIRVTKLLFTKYNAQYFYPRFLNQDPLENFFGRLRAHNYRNVNPDTNTFVYTFKALVLSNVLSPVSKFANCEEDEGEKILSLELLFTHNPEEEKENMPPSINIPSTSGSLYNVLAPVTYEKIKVHCSAYVAGYICRKLNKKVNCAKCKNTIVTKNIQDIHKYIQYREYRHLKNSNLVYPSEKILITYRESSQLIHNYMNKYAHLKNVGTNIKKYLIQNMNLKWMGCSSHKQLLQETFLRLITRLQIHNWVKMINKILRGSIPQKYISKMADPQKEAFSKYFKTRKRK